MALKDVTVREVYDALAKNGFEHLRGQWFEHDFDGNVIGGCVLAQTGINLGASANSGPNSVYVQLTQFPNISDKWFASNEDTEDVANTIVYWNDRENEEPGANDRHYLPTYKDVVNMAYDVLEPYFDRVITVEVVEYRFGQ